MFAFLHKGYHLFPTSYAIKTTGVAGWILLGSTTMRNSLERSAEKNKKMERIYQTLEAMLGALGETSVEIITEMLFPAYGRFAKSTVGKSIANGTRGLIEIVFKKTSKRHCKRWC